MDMSSFFFLLYLSQLGGWIRFRVMVSALNGVKLRQHYLPLLIVDKDHLLLILLLLFSITTTPVLILLFFFLLNYSSILL